MYKKPFLFVFVFLQFFRCVGCQRALLNTLHFPSLVNLKLIQRNLLKSSNPEHLSKKYRTTNSSGQKVRRGYLPAIIRLVICSPMMCHRTSCIAGARKMGWQYFCNLPVWQILTRLFFANPVRMDYLMNRPTASCQRTAAIVRSHALI